MDIRALNEFSGVIRKAVDDYKMIDEDDRIAVGVSGGKDSLLLLLALKHLQSYYPKRFGDNHRARLRGNGFCSGARAVRGAPHPVYLS